MAIKFEHQDAIKAARDYIPVLLKKKIPVKWNKTFANPDATFKGTCTSGTGKNEKLILEANIASKLKSVPVTFIEDAEGTLTVIIDDKKVKPSLKKGEGITSEKTFIKAMTKEIDNALK